MIRSLIIYLILSVIPIIVKSQDPFDSAVYKVAYHINAIRNGKPLHQGDLVSPSDTIKNSDGLLVLYHMRDRSLHLSQDTSFIVGQFEYLEESIKEVYPRSMWKLFDSSAVSYPATIDLRKLADHPEFLFSFPSHGSMNITREQGLCAIWEDYGVLPFPDTFRIVVKNIFDEPLQEFLVDTNMVSLSIPDTLNIPADLLLVEENDDENNFSDDAGFQIVPKKEEPTPCMASSPNELITLAKNLESTQRYQLALTYYQRAAEVAQQPLYQIIYQFAQSRLVDD